MRTILMSIIVVMAALVVAAPASASVMWDGTGSPGTLGFTDYTSASGWSYDTPAAGTAHMDTESMAIGSAWGLLGVNSELECRWLGGICWRASAAERSYQHQR